MRGWKTPPIVPVSPSINSAVRIEVKNNPFTLSRSKCKITGYACPRLFKSFVYQAGSTESEYLI